jgi:DNA-binding CsgD family transcriptional regulator
VSEVAPVERGEPDAETLLSPRERQVLEMAAHGLTNTQIANALNVTVHAVKFHLAAIYRKLGVTNRAEAAFVFLRAPAGSGDAEEPEPAPDPAPEPAGLMVDLELYSRVLWRFRQLVLLGFVLATLLAFLSFVKVDWNGLAYREKEQWVSRAVVLITEPDFPEGRAVFEQMPVVPAVQDPTAPEFAAPDRFTQLATLYAPLAAGDDVRSIMLRDGPLNGEIEAAPVLSPSEEILPMVSIGGIATTPEGAVSLSKRGSDAFRQFLEENQAANGIPSDERVILKTIRAPGEVELLNGRSLMLPIAVFLTVMLAFVGLAFLLENLQPRIRPPEADAAIGPRDTRANSRSA